MAFKKRRFRKAKKSVAVRALAKVNKIAKLINVEKKKLDTSGTFNAILAANPQEVLVSGMAQGLTVATREGNSVKCTSFTIGLRALLNNMNQDFTTLRVALVLDQKSAGASFDASDVYESLAATSPLKIANVGRFKVLKDWTIDMTEPDSKVKTIRDYIPFNHHFRFDGANANDYINTSVFLLAWTNEANYGPDLTYYIRMSFIDN